jgi:hypothetical protein
MESGQGQLVDLSGIVGIESQLVASLRETAGEIAHMDCFDEEQRAEIYTILHTLLAGTEEHCSIVGTIGNYVSGEAHA